MTTLDLPAGYLARAWLAVAQASGTDPAPVLDRTILVEHFDGRGVRLVSTDRVMLLHAWVPALDDIAVAAPDLDLVPTSAHVVTDPYGRAVGLMRHVRKLARADEKDGREYEATLRLELDVDHPDLDAAEPTFAGMEGRVAMVDLLDAERVVLDLYAGPYPSWRHLIAERPADFPVERVGLGADALSHLGSLGAMFPFGYPRFRFSGARSAIAFDVVGSDPYVSGLVMPIRLAEHDPDPTAEMDAESESFPTNIDELLRRAGYDAADPPDATPPEREGDE